MLVVPNLLPHLNNSLETLAVTHAAAELDDKFAAVAKLIAILISVLWTRGNEIDVSVVWNDRNV